MADPVTLEKVMYEMHREFANTQIGAWHTGRNWTTPAKFIFHRPPPVVRIRFVIALIAALTIAAIL